MGGGTNRWKFPPFSTLSGNGEFLQISFFGDFWVEVLIGGKFRRLLRQVEMMDFYRFQFLGIFGWKY